MAGQGWTKGLFNHKRPERVNNWFERERIATEEVYNDNSLQYFLFSGELPALCVGNISI